MRLSKVDPNSYSTPENEIITNIDLDRNIDFERHVVNGSATYTFKILAASIETIFLDVNDITIKNIVVKTAGTEFPVNYFISDHLKHIGSKLTIELPTKTSGELKLSIEYETSPKAAALQWLTPEQTLGKTHPYMYSQCQAIAARSLLPCQDTPAVKFTYTAVVTHPKELTALLSAIRLNSTVGRTNYEQKIPIPSYLLAIAVGAVVPRQIGPNSKVWAEEAIVDAAAEEFSATSSMLKTAEDICGSYVWKEYDLLECQNLIENNRRLMGDSLSSERLNGNSCVEDTLLQTQIDSLQWQLKQVEASRQMYHAVMEEVVRFLDRCHQSLNAMETNGRPKSMNHVFGNDCDGRARMRTSTNMLDRSIGEIGDVESNASLSGSYSNFRDFTWRRTPKQVQPSSDHNIELNPDKLSQEAFRLLRTAQNLISLKEPSLSDIPSDTQSFKSFEYNKTSTLQRKMNTRESRLSMQSSTDDSVHSTSSSRNETDEETHNHQSSSSSAYCLMPSTHLNRKDFIKSMTNTAGDDESGFSSMNSFQEIGIPTPIFSGSEKSADSAPETIPEDDNDTNDTTIMPSKYIGKTRHALPIIHRRWDSAPPIPPKRNSLSTYNGDDAPKVLWV